MISFRSTRGADSLFIVSIFVAIYGAIRAGHSILSVIIVGIIYGMGTFYGFESQSVVSGSGLGFGLERETLQSIGIVLAFLGVTVAASMSFRNRTNS